MKSYLIQKALKEKKLIGLRINPDDWNEVLIGFVVKLTNTVVLINELDSIARLTGETLVPLKKIVGVEFEDRYQRRLQFLYESKDKLDENLQVTIHLSSTDRTRYLTKLLKEQKITTFYFDDAYVTGFLIRFDKEWLLIHEIGGEGDDEGISCQLLDRLTGFKYNGTDEQKIKLLRDNSKLFYN